MSEVRTQFLLLSSIESTIELSLNIFFPALSYIITSIMQLYNLFQSPHARCLRASSLAQLNPRPSRYKEEMQQDSALHPGLAVQTAESLVVF